MLILLSAVGVARILTAAADRSLSHTRAMCELLSYTRRMIESFSMSGEEILGRCDDRLLGACGYFLGVRPKSFIELFERCEIVDGECRRIFGDFCRNFGKGYRDEQLRNCEYCLSLLAARSEVLASENATKKKIIIASTLSVALMLAILLV